MAKKAAAKSTYSFRFFLILLLVAAGGTGWWFWKKNAVLEIDNWKNKILSYVDNRDILTLEAKYTPDQMVEAYQVELKASDDDNRTWQEPTLKYYPYLLLDVKYTENQKSREGVLLWGLVDGEMVLNTVTWETSHGFKDCLDCQASRSDFKIMQALARAAGSLSIESLQKELQVERETLDIWLENAKYKHLVVQKGPIVQLHFQNPKLLVIPQTQMDRHLVSKPSANSQKVDRAFNRNQILTVAKAAFGDDFKVRSEQEVYLPVYTIQVRNPDGSLYSSDWNAVTGRRIYPYYWALR